MELTMTNAFCEMNEMEMQEVDGGFVFATIAIGAATIEVTGTMIVGAITTAWALGKTAYEIYNAFTKEGETTNE